MNGRIYSPKLGRMLSPDPVTQAPENGQNYDRYTYAFNNPLKFKDPSGYKSEEDANTACYGDSCTNNANASGGFVEEVVVTASSGNGGSIGNLGATVGSFSVSAVPATNPGDRPEQSADDFDCSQEGGLACQTVVGNKGKKFHSVDELVRFVGPWGIIFGVRHVGNIGLVKDTFGPRDLRDFFGRETNVDPVHEHVFLVDGESNLTDSGFFGDGDLDGDIRPDMFFPDNIGDYWFEDVHRNVDTDSIDLSPPGFGNGFYDTLKRNCQHYADAIRSQLGDSSRGSSCK